MHRFLPVVVAVAVTCVAGSVSRAAGPGVAARTGEPDAAALAAAIDELVDARLKAAGIAPADPVDDAGFLRRVSLDLHGVVPTAARTARFLEDTRPDRRARLIDELLAAPRYGDHLGDVWQGLLMSPLADDRRLRGDRLGQRLAAAFNTQTWDRIVADLVTASGRIEDEAAVLWLVEGRLPRSVPDLTDAVSRHFLGIRLSCAQCHDHPFVALKQDVFWGMAAFFAPVQTPGRPKQIYRTGLKDQPGQTLDALKVDGVPDGFLSRPARFLDGTAPTGGRAADRAALAEWMTSRDNPWFARAMANRTWWRLFGRGLVNPVDDLHAANAPSHPELLDLLAARFAASGFDLKHLTRAVVLTRAYQRSSRTTGPDPDRQAALFGRMSAKVLTAGQLYDSYTAVLGAPARRPGAGAARDPRAEFVEFFSDDGDADPTAYRRGIPHVLRQMNADQFAGRGLTALANRIAVAGRAANDVAGELFLAILSRRPTDAERTLFADHAVKAGSTVQAARELAWALLMTAEFSLNH